MTTIDTHLTALEPSHLALAYAAVHKYGALQDEWEFAQLIDLVKQTGVSTMLEIGSCTGGSLWAWRQVVPNVLAVTLGVEAGFHSHGASIVYGDSTDLAVQAMVENRLGDQTVDFVYIDGGHDARTSHSDFDWARKLVKKGLIGLHDINLHHRFPQDDFIGPHLLWELAKLVYPHFEIVNVAKDDPGVGVFFIR